MSGPSDVFSLIFIWIPFILVDPFVDIWLWYVPCVKINPPSAAGWDAKMVKERAFQETCELRALYLDSLPRSTKLVLYVSACFVMFSFVNNELKIVLALGLALLTYYRIQLMRKMRELDNKEKQWDAWEAATLAEIANKSKAE